MDLEHINFFTKALRIRRIEEAIAKEYPNQEMRCPVHLSIGQEANAVAIAEMVKKDDYMVSTHRGHAHYLAKGGPLVGLLGELYGRSVGCSRGFGGSMHLTDIDSGFLASTSIVGGTIPIGLGAAFSSMVKKDNKVSVVCIGDAATEEGVFHEAANFAGLHKLPIIFFMENNNYSCFTSRDKRQPERGFEPLAMAHGLQHFKIRAKSFYKDFQFVKQAIEEMREDNDFLPTFIECEAYRFVEHCGPNSDDHLNYRPEAEVSEALKHDFINQLIVKIKKPELKAIEEKIAKEIHESFNYAKTSPVANWVEQYSYA